MIKKRELHIRFDDKDFNQFEIALALVNKDRVKNSKDVIKISEIARRALRLGLGIIITQVKRKSS